MLQHAKVIAMNLGLLAESLIMVSGRFVFLSNVTGQVAPVRALQGPSLVLCHKCTVRLRLPFYQYVVEGHAFQNF